MIETWRPDSGETLLTRTRLAFATGAAVPVSGSRWFRDTGRNDIQHELPDWPDGPTYSLHTQGKQAASRGGRFLRTAIPVLVGVAIEALGGTGSWIDPKTLGQPTEPEDEVHDFPVMWAAPGAIARTMPWQLDPGRRPKGCSTHGVVTDRRIVFLQQGPEPADTPEELHSLPHELIANTERMRFSRNGSDMRLWFTDRSWIRLAIPDPDLGTMAYFRKPLLVHDEELNAPQRDAVTTWLARWENCVEPPVIIRLPSGNLLIQQRVPWPGRGYGYLTQSHTINSDGAPAYDRADFLGGAK